MKQRDLVKRLEKWGFEWYDMEVIMTYIKEEVMKSKFQDIVKLTRN